MRRPQEGECGRRVQPGRAGCCRQPLEWGRVVVCGDVNNDNNNNATTAARGGRPGQAGASDARASVWFSTMTNNESVGSEWWDVWAGLSGLAVVWCVVWSGRQRGGVRGAPSALGRSTQCPLSQAGTKKKTQHSAAVSPQSAVHNHKQSEGGKSQARLPRESERRATGSGGRRREEKATTGRETAKASETATAMGWGMGMRWGG